ncbi:MAG: four helix bundle protein [Candidatus Hydrogenedens sp.]|nr:four helix bundle protein [Candidatus Hydrogenedens sp.]
MSKSYRELQVWQKAVDMVVSVYEVTAEFPAQEKYGLASQTQRAAVSVPANIAEGYGRVHRGDYVHHLSIARGSLAELETHVTIAARLGFIQRDKALNLWNMTQETGRMLTSMILSLQGKKRESAIRKGDDE